MNDENPNQEAKPHQRRVRYKGTHPKKFAEKYKELDGEKYKEEISKVIARGQTPAGMHIPICVKEILKCLNIQPADQGLDCTLGYGGHSFQMLKKLGPLGNLTSLDVDSKEFPKTVERIRNRGFDTDLFTPVQMNFCEIDKLVEKRGRGFDFILADLGISSMQIDSPDRGFSFKIDSPIDLRLDTAKGEPAYKVLAQLDEEELLQILIEHSDEPLAPLLAPRISQMAQKGNLTTTFAMRDLILKVIQSTQKNAKEEKEILKATCQRVFQAIRIYVNQEFKVLDELLEKIPQCLNPGGRVAFLTFHSGEDRRVKQSFKEGYYEGIYKEVLRRPIRAGAEERRRNPRSTSAKLRFAIRA